MRFHFLLFGALILAVSAAASGQTSPTAPFRKEQGRDDRRTPLPQTKASKTALKFKPLAKGGQIKLTAKSQQWVKEDFWRGEGLVDVVYQDIRVQAERIEVNLKTKEIVAEGDVVLDQVEKRLSGSRLEFNLEKKTGVIYDATGNLEASYFVTGSKIEKIDETRYRIVDGVFTSCDQTVPTWSFRVAEALLHIDHYAYLKGTTMRIKRMPILYSPYLVWPVKPDRTRGLLIPNIGYDDRRGSYLGLAYFIPFGTSWDATLYGDFYERRYRGAGAELRWAPTEDATGKIEYLAYDDDERPELRWKAKAQYFQEKLPLGFRAVIDYRDYSDFDWFQDFERTFAFNSTRSIYSDAYLSRNGPVFSFNVLADRRQTLLGDTLVELAQYPQVALRGRPWRLGASPFYFSLESSANNFHIDRGEDNRGDYYRGDFFPSFSASLTRLPWLALSPKVSWRETYYSQSLGPSRQLVDEPLERGIGYGEVNVVGPSFSRIFGGAGGFTKLKHVIEPRIEYNYVSPYDDTARVPAFDIVDSVQPLHQVRIALVNRLLGKRDEAAGTSASEIASFEVFQIHSFDGDRPLSVSPTLGETSPRSPIGAILRVSPGPSMNLSANVTYDILHGAVASTNVSGALHRGRNNLNLTWYRGEALEIGQQPSSQIRIYGGFDLMRDRLRADAQLNYDIERQLMQQQRYMLSYTGQCFGAFLELRNYEVGTNKTRDYRFAITLKNVGTFLDVNGGLDPLF